jgi:hypothetical protein
VAKAIDNRGESMTSAPVCITVSVRH